MSLDVALTLGRLLEANGVDVVYSRTADKSVSLRDRTAMANAAGISPELLHRIAALAAGCLDTLPHSGAVITLLAICGMTHKQSYGNVAMCTVVIPMVSVTVAITLGTVFGSF